MSTENDPRKEDTGDEPHQAFFATVVVCALLLGGLAGFAVSNLGTVPTVVVFGVVTASTGYYLYSKPAEYVSISGKEVPATVLHPTLNMTAVIVLLTPVVLYVSRITVGGQDIQIIGDITVMGGDSENLLSLDGMDMGLTSIDSILALVFWIVVAVTSAGVLRLVGKKLGSKATEK